MQTYIVKSGDTLYGISNQFGVSVTELAELNGIKGSFLAVGRELKIPSKSGTNPNNLFMYTVVSGDTLSKIARKYNTTVKAIKDLNYLTTDNLTIGQVIRIPEMYTPEEEMYMPSFINYTVKKGDSLYTIAKTYNIDINTLKKDNSLTSNIINVGQILKIRTDEENIEIEECFGEDYIPPETENSINYVVKSGDSLYKIANKYNTSVSVIMNLNNLKTSNLSIGQTLKIPVSESGGNTIVYTVKSGDNLYSIARKYNTTVDAIKKKNNLKTNNLSIGQKLQI